MIRLGALTKLGKFGGNCDERNSSSIPVQTISVSPKRVWLNVANQNYAEVDVKTKVHWNAF